MDDTYNVWKFGNDTASLLSQRFAEEAAAARCRFHLLSTGY